MYEIVEAGRGTARVAVPYPTLDAATDGLVRRAAALLRLPGTRVVTQRPRRITVLGGDGTLLTLEVRRAPTLRAALPPATG